MTPELRRKTTNVERLARALYQEQLEVIDDANEFNSFEEWCAFNAVLLAASLFTEKVLEHCSRLELDLHADILPSKDDVGYKPKGGWKLNEQPKTIPQT